MKFLVCSRSMYKAKINLKPINLTFKNYKFCSNMAYHQVLFYAENLIFESHIPFNISYRDAYLQPS